MKHVIALTGIALVILTGCRPQSSQTGVSATSAADSSNASVVRIVAREFSFEPNEITVTAGTTTFQIKNEGSLEHEFEIFKGDQLGTHADLVDEVEDIAPGLTRDLKVKLDSGRYSFACMLPGHSEQGQRGVLTVK